MVLMVNLNWLKTLPMDRIVKWPRILWASNNSLTNLSNSHKLGPRALLNHIHNLLNHIKFRETQELSFTLDSSMHSGDTIHLVTTEVITINITITISITITNTTILILTNTSIPNSKYLLPLHLSILKLNHLQMRNLREKR